MVTLVGVIVMMLTISWILTLVAMLTLPLSVGDRDGHRQALAGLLRQPAEGAGRAQRPRGGDVSPATRSSRRSATSGKSIAKFDALNDRLYDAGWRAQFVTGIIMPLMMFVGNLGYVLVAVIGGILVTQQAIAIGDVQAFIQYSRQFSQPITQLASIANMIQLTIAVGRAGLRAARRAGGDARRGRRGVIAAPKGASSSSTSRSATRPTSR